MPSVAGNLLPPGVSDADALLVRKYGVEGVRIRLTGDDPAERVRRGSGGRENDLDFERIGGRRKGDERGAEGGDVGLDMVLVDMMPHGCLIIEYRSIRMLRPIGSGVGSCV